MNKFYVVCNTYYPNTAFSNRVFSFLRGFSELGVDVEVVFLTPDSEMSKVQETYPHITFKYMWRICHFQTAFSTNLLMSSMDGSLHGV